ncbi:MAG: sigma-54-dependent Fis family transcriptional regulator [Burkholderiaceae bacterium]|nr:sigma-54-dependent Fis family transcriptional regulator [Burkholderiaceae bacterium]
MKEGNDKADERAAVRTARTPRVLVVDEEADLRELLELTLVGMGLDVDCAARLAEAEALLERGTYALCLTDMRLPDGDGLALVAAINRRFPQTPVAVITAYGSAENAVAALKSGAFDYLAKPVALDALRSLVRSAIQLPAAQPAAVPAGEATPAADGAWKLLGDSAAMQEVRAQIQRLARSMAPVSITGESGSGKELAARLIHRSGARAAQPFIAVNCGAIPETLMEAEFFGHRKGAFTGADQDRDGFFQAASGGTLFLDEVADLPLAMQVKLLRAIQEKRVRKVGATVEEAVDVRIISATHQDLAQCVTAGRFRQDLYYRLNVIELKLPPLRGRHEDIPLLAESILARLAARAGNSHVPRLSSITVRYLQSYQFPGNVRELENMLERALAFCNGEVINVEDLGLKPIVSDADENERAEAPGEAEAHAQGGPQPAAMAGASGVMSGHGAVGGLSTHALAGGISGHAGGMSAHAVAGGVSGHAATGGLAPGHGHGPGGASTSERRLVRVSEDGIPESLPDYLDQIERDTIQRALDKTRYNRTAAARLLGITFRALRYRMQRLGLN